MPEKIFDASNVDLSTFQLFSARNGQLDLDTAALRVTLQNIGVLSLAFNSDVHRHSDDNIPYFGFRAKRDTEHGCRYIEFLVGDVLVFVRDEIRRFDKEIFENTFTTTEFIEYCCSVCGKISGDNEVGTYSETHPVTDGLAYCDMKLKV